MKLAKILASKLQKNFSSGRFGAHIHCLQTCLSTNDKALELAKNKAPDGTIVVALKQDKGRGRRNRIWLTEEGGLALSLIIRPNFDASKAYRVVFLAASAIIAALEELGVEAKLKWPNDVLIAKKKGHDADKPYGKYAKIAGVLIELASCREQADAIVVGIGINVNRPAKSNILNLIDGVGFVDDARKTLTIEKVLFELLTKFEQKLSKPEDEDSFLFELNSLRVKCVTLGHKVTVDDNGNSVSALATALNDDGSLSVEKSGGQISKIYAGDVHIKF